MHATSAPQLPALPTAALASPQPTRPSSVSMRTRAMSKLAMRPKSETCWRSVGIGTDSQRASTLADDQVGSRSRSYQMSGSSVVAHFSTSML